MASVKHDCAVGMRGQGVGMAEVLNKKIASRIHVYKPKTGNADAQKCTQYIHTVTIYTHR